MSEPFDIIPMTGIEMINPNDVAIDLEGPVMLSDRTGVYGHSFKCLTCRLEFVLFSWVADRHPVGKTYCPECGTTTPMRHYGAVLSRSPDSDGDPDGSEIYQLVPLPGSELLIDSTLPTDQPDGTT